MMRRVKALVHLPAPESIQVGGNVLEIRLVSALGADSGVKGTCCLGTRIIELDAGMIADSKTSTLLHELVEAINTVWLAGALEHGDIDRLGEALFQSLSDMGIEVDWQPTP